jgi:hypothetical protein
VNRLKNIKLFVPESIKKIIDANVMRNRESYYYIIDFILKRQRNNTDPKEKKYINIYAIDKGIINNPKRCILKLKELNVIYDDKKSIHGLKRLHYRVTEDLINDVSIIDVPPDNFFYKKLKNTNSKNHIRRKLKQDHLFKMYQSFCKLKIDETEALNYIQKNIQKPQRKFYYSLAVYNFSNKRFNRNQTNFRLDTNLTNLPKVLREFVFNENYVCLDLKNSQIIFLLFIIELLSNTIITIPTFNSGTVKFLNIKQTVGITALKKIQKITEKRNFAKNGYFLKFKNLCLTGNFYQYFAPLFKKSVPETKNLIFKIMFSKSKDYAKFKEICRNEFEDIFKIMELIKSRKHNTLSNTLSKLESYVFLDVICKKLVESGIIPFTIHDCIIVAKQHQKQALDIIKDSFKELFDEVPTFSIEPLKQPKSTITKHKTNINMQQKNIK